MPFFGPLLALFLIFPLKILWSFKPVINLVSDQNTMKFFRLFFILPILNVTVAVPYIR